jgi:hypothetical protein
MNDDRQRHLARLSRYGHPKMTKLKLFSLVGAALTLASCAVVNALPRAVSQPTAQPVQDNLIGLFILKRNNLNQQYRGEIYPLAQYRNGRYSDASLDVTPEVREDSKEAEIVQRNAAKSVLNTNPTLTIMNPSHALGKFSVDRLGVGRFACSAVLIGRGKLVEQSDLNLAFNQLPAKSQRASSGAFNGQEFDETWRSAIAAKMTTPATTVRPTQAQLDQYRKDLIRIGTSAIAKNPQAKSVQGTVALVDLRVFDLNGDGQPEVFGKLRKASPRSDSPNRDRPTVTSIYANVWLGYGASQPKLLSSQVVPYFVPGSEAGRIYEIVGTIDGNGDGQQEVLIQNNGYESITFSLYELQGNQLKSVFTGAGYGC